MSLFASLDSLKNTMVGLKSSSKAKRTSTLSKEIAPCSMYPYTAKDIVNHEYRDMYFTPWSENVIPIVQGVE